MVLGAEDSRVNMSDKSWAVTELAFLRGDTE